MAISKERKRQALAQVALVGQELRRWDPINTRPGVDGPADEYDCYAPHIVSMVASGSSVQDLCAHLGELRSNTIGLGPDAASDQIAAVAILRVLKGSAV